MESPPTYNADYGYKSWEAYSNLSYYTRTLPPLPKHCPSKNTTALPDPKQVVEKVLLRQKFIPDPQGTSLMFAFFAQHFTHQFFKSDLKKGPAFTKALGHGVSPSYTHISIHSFGTRFSFKVKLLVNIFSKVFIFVFQVDLSHIYGNNLEKQHKLRLFKDGKLKYQVRS